MRRRRRIIRTASHEPVRSNSAAGGIQVGNGQLLIAAAIAAAQSAVKLHATISAMPGPRRRQLEMSKTQTSRNPTAAMAWVTMLGSEGCKKSIHKRLRRPSLCLKATVSRLRGDQLAYVS
jgi:hypothetical protein